MRARPRSIVFSVPAFLMFLSAPVEAAPLTLQHTLNNPTPEFDEQFGYSVALSGNTALVAARRDNDGAADTGAAYLYDATTGNLLHTLNNPDPEISAEFGSAVALSGNTALVGARLDDTVAPDVGSAYLFDATTGSLLHTLDNPTPQFADRFGNAVALSGNTALVGAFGDEAGAGNAGAAHLFDVTTGNLLQTLNNPTPANNDQFGYAVALSGNNALIGAIDDDTGATNAGSAYLFDATTGNLLQTLNNPSPETGDRFGFSTAIDGNIALVGALGDNTGAASAGAAYLFDVTTGNLLQTFLNPTPANSEEFGFSVALFGDTALIGAHRADDGITGDTGFAYLFDVVSGNLLQTFTNPSPVFNDQFGFSVALSDKAALIGARFDTTGAADTGAAYLFADATAVPEPVPLAILASGFLALICMRRRRRT